MEKKKSNDSKKVNVSHGEKKDAHPGKKRVTLRSLVKVVVYTICVRGSAMLA
jgi:hypothetical protein